MKKYIVFVVFVLVVISAIYYCRWDWVIDHEELAAGFVTSVILILALIGALLTLRAMQHDRTTSLTMTISQIYESGVIFEARKLTRKIVIWQESCGIQDEPANFFNIIMCYRLNYVDEFIKLESIPALYDMIGWLVRKKCCEYKAIDEQLDWKVHYKLWKPYIRYKQGKTETEELSEKASDYYGNFVYLANKLLSEEK